MLDQVVFRDRQVQPSSADVDGPLESRFAPTPSTKQESHPAVLTIRDHKAHPLLCEANSLKPKKTPTTTPPYPQTVSISYLVQAVVARPDGPLPQPQKTLAAFQSGDCCLGHPKMKLFASERSPNLSHQLLSHSLPESCGISLGSELISLYTTSTTAVGSVIRRGKLTPTAHCGNKLISKRQRLGNESLGEGSQKLA